MIRVREWGEWGEAMGAKPKFARRFLKQWRLLHSNARNEGYKVQLMRLPDRQRTISCCIFTIKNYIKSDRKRALPRYHFLISPKFVIKSDRKRAIPVGIFGCHCKKFDQIRSKKGHSPLTFLGFHRKIFHEKFPVNIKKFTLTWLYFEPVARFRLDCLNITSKNHKLCAKR